MLNKKVNTFIILCCLSLVLGHCVEEPNRRSRRGGRRVKAEPVANKANLTQPSVRHLARKNTLKNAVGKPAYFATYDL